MRIPTDSLARPKVLYLAHRVPFPPDKGDRIRTYHQLRWLGRRADVYLACLADEPVTADIRDALEGLARRVAVVPVGGWSRRLRMFASLVRGRTATEGAFASGALSSTITEWAQEVRFDACLASASSMVPYMQLPALRWTPAIVDLVDVDSQKWLDYAAASRGPRSWLYRLEGHRLRCLERPLPTWARGVLLTSTAEVDLYRQFADDGPIYSINNGVDLDYFRPAPPAEGASCVFVGALDYRPNVDAACWFCREVWPDVVRRRPDARLVLVGRQPVPAIRRLGELPGVIVVGQVPDVRPHVAEATVVVAPLRIARGVQNKVLEALAMAKATVASSAALGGIRAVSGQHLLAADSPAEWVDALLRLFDHAELRRTLGTAGRRYVEEQHSWDSRLQPLEDILGLQASSAAG
jgi:sugar transferase (PEP-CTERM/EpsH1 system associated)